MSRVFALRGKTAKDLYTAFKTACGDRALPREGEPKNAFQAK